METETERIEQRRDRNRMWFLVWASIFFLLWFLRSGLKLAGVEHALTYSLLLAGLLLTLGLQIWTQLNGYRLQRQMNADPQLRAAMNDELVQLNALKAWRAAFFAMTGCILLAALLSMLIEINDPMLVYLTALLTGFGAYNMAVYILNK